MLAPHPHPRLPEVSHRSWIVFFLAALLLTLTPHLAVWTPPAPPAAPPAVTPDLAALPLLFVANQGQTDPRVAYYVQGSDKTLFFTTTGITIVLPEAQADQVGTTPDQPARWTVRLDFVGANPDVRPVGEARAETTLAYFKGRPDQWQTAIPTFQKLVYPELWPGIDLVYFGTAGRLKYEFVVHAGADPAQIRLAYHGASAVQLTPDGRIDVRTGVGSFSDAAPIAYQMIDGEQRPVTSRYALDAPAADGSVGYGFALGAYDPAYPLVIDPEMLVYAGYIGGISGETGADIAVDAEGYAYIAGATVSPETSFPATVGPDLTFNLEGDAYVAKVRPDGSGLVFAGYIGGDKLDFARGIAIDSGGNLYITGTTNSAESSFPALVGPNLSFSNTIYADAFVAKVRADGSDLIYAGYIGGAERESGDDIAVDAAGAAYVIGQTSSTPDAGFPARVGPDVTFNGGERDSDAFVAKVSIDGSSLLYAGYIGGSKSDTGYGIAVDASGAAYIAGSTYSAQDEGFPLLVGPDLTFNAGVVPAPDGFVAKVQPDGGALIYSGYIGGTNWDEAFAIAIDAEGHAYLAGRADSSESNGFPVRGGPDLTFNGGEFDSDAFVAKVRADGSDLIYAGYIGGRYSDRADDIALDAERNVYITGSTFSAETSFPVKGGLDLIFNDTEVFGGDIGGYGDAFVAKVRADFSELVFAGYLGTSQRDEGSGIAVDPEGYVYISGYMTEVLNDGFSTPFTPKVGPDLTFNGLTDAFVAKLYGGEIVVAPSIGLNFSDGAPGSVFLVEGADFPAQAAVQFRVNGVDVGDPVRADAEGNLRLLLETVPTAAEGVYVIAAIVAATSESNGAGLATATTIVGGLQNYRLASDGDLRTAPVGAPSVSITVPETVPAYAQAPRLFLPLTVR